MKKDIIIPKVEDVAIAIVPEETPAGEREWNVYLINQRKAQITGVLVTSRGYGHDHTTAKAVKSSTLRHFLDSLEPESFKKIEPIQEELFGLSNEFWLSFYEDKLMYDKKYIFMAESVKEENFIQIPLINKMGVMIK